MQQRFGKSAVMYRQNRGESAYFGRMAAMLQRTITSLHSVRAPRRSG
jgi:hypothetical protein